MRPTQWPHPLLQAYWESGTHAAEGATQPAIQNLLMHLLRLVDAPHAVELGVWKGATSRWLACGLPPGGRLELVDPDQGCLHMAADRVGALALPITVTTHRQHTMDYLPTIPDTVRFVFLDDDKAQIPEKLGLLTARLPHCVVAIHDLDTIGAQIWKDGNLIPLRVASDPSGGDLGLTSW